MNPVTMQAMAAERGRDLFRDATAARRGRKAHRRRSWQQAQPTQQAQPVAPALPTPRTRRDLKPAA